MFCFGEASFLFAKKESPIAQCTHISRVKLM